MSVFLLNSFLNDCICKTFWCLHYLHTDETCIYFFKTFIAIESLFFYVHQMTTYSMPISFILKKNRIEIKLNTQHFTITVFPHINKMFHSQTISDMVKQFYHFLSFIQWRVMRRRLFAIKLSWFDNDGFSCN